VTTILLTGKTGQVGMELQRALTPLGQIIAPGRAEMDHADADSIRAAIRTAKPSIIVNAAGYTTVDKAEAETSLAIRINAVAPGILAEEAKRIGAPLIHFSTDYVYDGEQDRPYTEDDAPNPVNAYGKSKLAGEQAIQAVGGAHLILRTSWAYSARGNNFVLLILRLAREKPRLQVVSDQVGSPSWARNLAESTASIVRKPLLINDRPGVYHFSAAGQVSRYEFARAIIRIMKEISGSSDGWPEIVPITSAAYTQLPARRPLNTVTDKSKIRRVFDIEMPVWDAQLRSFLSEFATARRP
jgi:dTDP-4-dehydrorhamnose reductase